MSPIPGPAPRSVPATPPPADPLAWLAAAPGSPAVATRLEAYRKSLKLPTREAAIVHLIRVYLKVT